LLDLWTPKKARWDPNAVTSTDFYPCRLGLQGLIIPAGEGLLCMAACLERTDHPGYSWLSFELKLPWYQVDFTAPNDIGIAAA
jgi:hypothetical protein